MSSLNQVLQSAVGHAFEIGRELHGGGMSRVFLAREPALNRDVVVKVLPPDLLSTSSLQRFRREVEVTARLQHPHILPVITVGGNNELRYYVAPFIRGESLRARLATATPLPFGDAVRIADEILNAIAFAHAHGVVHRDIKPSNILLSVGHAILADFGIAAFIEGEQAAHSDHDTGSTIDSSRVYSAPEQPRDEQRDLFGAAVVIHEMLAGFPASAGSTAAAIASALKARHPQAPAPDVRRVSSALARALSIDPNLRYETASEMRSALQANGRASRRPMLIGIGIGGIAAMFALSVFALRSFAPDASPLVQQADSPVHSPPSGDSDLVASRSEPRATALPTPAAPPRRDPMAPLDSATFLFHRGDLSGAGDLYRVAASTNAAESRAQLGLAITAGLDNTPPSMEIARVAAERALAASPALDAHDRAVAEGFIALADRRYPDACAAFTRARESRATFEAWMGLGECALRDDAVMVGVDGPAFRSGYASASRAFVNAIRATAPHTPSLAYRRLLQAVPQTSADIRMGRTADNRIFVGNWRIVDDTLGVTLRPSGPAAVAPEVFVASAAAAKNGRDMLRPALLSWIANSPEEPAAHEALSLLLENGGTIAETGDYHFSALSAIETARRLEKEPARALRLAATHGRLLLRARRYEQLANLADSLLAANAQDSPSAAEALMPLAMLTGRIDRATELLAQLSGTSSRQVRGADGRPVELPPTVLRERAGFLVRASLGVCDAQVKAAPKRLVEVLDAAFPAGVPRGVEASFAERIVLFALPCLGPSVTTTLREPGRSLQMWARAFDPADTGFADEYAARDRARGPVTAGAESGVDGVIVDVMVKLALDDSSAALRQLSLALDRLPLVGRGLFSSEWTVGSTARGMALAAETASGLGDRETAQRWSSAIAVLWRNADQELQPQVARLRAIAQATADDPGRE